MDAPDVVPDVLGIKVTKQSINEENDAVYIEGIVFLSKSDDSDVARLSVKVVGRESTSLGSQGTRRYLHQHRNFLRRSLTLVEYAGCKLGQGEYCYGFSLSLMRQMLPPCILFRNFGSRCMIEYELVAQLHKITGRDVCGRTPFVWYLPSPHVPGGISGPRKTSVYVVRKCRLIPKGIVEMEVSMARSLLAHSEAVQLIFEVHNDSDVGFVGIKVVFHQLLVIRAGGKTETTERAHVSDFCQYLDDFDPDLEGLQGEISLWLPGDFHPSFEGQLISCRHAVEVALIARSGHCKVSTRLPIWIMHPLSGSFKSSTKQVCEDPRPRDHKMSDMLESNVADLPQDWQERPACGPTPLGCVEYNQNQLNSIIEQATSSNNAGLGRRTQAVHVKFGRWVARILAFFAVLFGLAILCKFSFVDNVSNMVALIVILVGSCLPICMFLYARCLQYQDEIGEGPSLMRETRISSFAPTPGCAAGPAC